MKTIWGKFSNENYERGFFSKTMDKAAPKGAALPDASAPLRSPLAPTPHPQLLTAKPLILHILNFPLPPLVFYFSDRYTESSSSISFPTPAIEI